MPRPDDSSLSPEDLRAVERHARELLDEADVWEIFPVPLDEILGAAKVKVAPKSAFDPNAIMAYIKGKAANVENAVKSALSKILGICDANESIIHVDDTVKESKQAFLTLHEVGHHHLPTHRKSFSIFQDCEKTLCPEIADQFEREANNFARYALFKGDTFASYAADCEFGIKTPMKLAKKFGASIYASAREFARTNARDCVVYVLEQPAPGGPHGAYVAVRRIEPSAGFKKRFGTPSCEQITPDHALWNVIPFGRKMTRPTNVILTDKNGDKHECLAEAFDTTFNIIILLYSVSTLTRSIILMPSDKQKKRAS